MIRRGFLKALIAAPLAALIPAWLTARKLNPYGFMDYNRNICYLPGGGVAFWSRWDDQLTKEEVDALASGVSLLKVRPKSLIAYFPMWTGK